MQKRQEQPLNKYPSECPRQFSLHQCRRERRSLAAAKHTHWVFDLCWPMSLRKQQQQPRNNTSSSECPCLFTRRERRLLAPLLHTHTWYFMCCLMLLLLLLLLLLPAVNASAACRSGANKLLSHPGSVIISLTHSRHQRKAKEGNSMQQRQRERTFWCSFAQQQPE